MEGHHTTNNPILIMFRILGLCIALFIGSWILFSVLCLLKVRC